MKHSESEVNLNGEATEQNVTLKIKENQELITLIQKCARF